MTVGFQSFTDSGVLQLDSAVKHLVFHSTGALTSFPTTVTSGVSKQGEIVLTGMISPIVFIKEGHGLVRNIIKSGSTYTYRILTKWAITSVTYYVFDVIPNTPTGTFGLQMYTSAGELSFDSNMRPLIPFYLQSRDATDSISAVSGREYAVSYSGFPLYGVFDSMFSDEVARYILTCFFLTRASSTLLSLEDWYFRGSSPGAFGEFPSPYPGNIARSKLPVLVSIVDVTGL